MDKRPHGEHYSVYVVELSREVLSERRFIEANPHRNPRLSCVYVGCTGLSPDERLRNHQLGYKSNRFVYRYGIRLLPELYEHLNPMTYSEARKMEKELAGKLRIEGYAVWQN